MLVFSFVGGPPPVVIRGQHRGGVMMMLFGMCTAFSLYVIRTSSVYSRGKHHYHHVDDTHTNDDYLCYAATMRSSKEVPEEMSRACDKPSQLKSHSCQFDALSYQCR